MKSLSNRLTAFALSLVVLSVVAPLAMANSAELTMFGFGGGTVTYNKNTQELTGTNISVELLLSGSGANATPLNPGQFSGVTGACGGACLDFTTGKLSNVSGNTWTFGGAGTDTFSITGSDIGAGVPSSTTLLNLIGSFSTAQAVFGSGGLVSFNLQGADSKAPGLLTYFGLPAATPFSFISAFTGEDVPNPSVGHAFAAPITGALITNTAVGAIPEPSSVILLLTVIGATLLLYRARSRKSKRSAY